MSDKDKGFNYIPITTPILYKFKEIKEASKVILVTYKVVKETDKGWFIECAESLKYVSKSQTKKYADPTLEGARLSFGKRMMATIDTANGMISLARLRTMQMETIYEREKEKDGGDSESGEKKKTS